MKKNDSVIDQIESDDRFIDKIREAVEWFQLMQIAKEFKLPKVDEEMLFIRLKNGESNAIEEILDCWEWIIINIARRYLHQVSIRKLINAGRQGLKSQIEVDLNFKRIKEHGEVYINQSMMNLVTLSQIN